MIFRSRHEAGKHLAPKFLEYKGQTTVALALPRGGIPVGAPIAKLLDVPLEVLVVRKIGAPFNPELALGAICEDVTPQLSTKMMTHIGLNAGDLYSIIKTEEREVHRQIKLFRGGKELPSLSNKSVILVDDGLATGSTMVAAIRYLKSKGIKQIIACAPVAASHSAQRIRQLADHFIAVEECEDLVAVGCWYEDFKPVTDKEVIQILKASRKSPPSSPFHTREISIPENKVDLVGDLTVFPKMKALILFAHGSGSSRKSPRNIQVAEFLNQNGFGTLLFDLLTEEEAKHRYNTFDITLLGNRLARVTRWLNHQPQFTKTSLGYFGASTGSAAALYSASLLHDDDHLFAIVSRGGRPDLAEDVLESVGAPTLLVVGGQDEIVLGYNRRVQQKIRHSKVVVISNASHLFEEPGTLEEVAHQSAVWFLENLPSEPWANSPASTYQTSSLSS